MQQKKRIIVIGGSAAGPKAAAKARRLDENAEIVIIQKAPDLSMASCGYPYYVGGFFDDRNMLLCTPTGVVRDPKFYLNAKGIVAKTQTEATKIDRKAKTVTVKDLRTGKEEVMAYDRLVITTGAVPKKPPIPGADLKGITTLQSMQDADYLRKVRDDKLIKKAVIIGGGLIGIETCEALELAGIEITVIEMLPQLLTFLDWELAKLVENHVRSKKANVITENGIAEFLGENGTLTGVKLQNGIELPCELAVVAIGVSPNAKLAKEAGLETGATGGLIVNEYMQTSDPDIYAAGDCVESVNLITGKKVHAPFGDLANLQGRVAGENAAIGNAATFPGTIQTGACKVFDINAGATGLSEKTAKAAGFTDIETVINASPDKPGFMEGLLLVTKIVVDKKSGKILGAQCVGPGDVSKQLATWAMAIKGGLTVEEMVNADLPYAPPFSLAIDHSIATAHIVQNKLKGRMKGISCSEVKAKIDNGEKPFILDTRGPDEYEQMRLGIGERLIPLGALRNRLGELPEDKNAEIICYCKISLRGYEAARVLEGRGWTNVKVMEGGIMAWPFPREK
ncbi:MAG TPA: FAD-dependent oxidoreductase [Spirochaetota bacterium]|nr:FAD-dependent oxidoreductase [Spirochaetota bacterium]HPI87901.1 FAD-dependent oxidoreductase [Spirochaetota bacterium]HPR47367.1 FAD-dependent oxidoreductase [Spirochaetota bacterium]